MIKKWAAILVVLAVAGFSGTASAMYPWPYRPSSSGSVQPQPQQSGSVEQTLDTCLHYKNHVYEVCTAYVFNSSLAVLAPYYKYAHDSNPAWRSYVTYRLGQRYVGQANSLIQSRVANWPAGTLEVNPPIIYIESVHSSLRTNTATLVTYETWRVTTQSGRMVYSETNQRHVIIMHRVPSYILHKWVVSSIR